jgi:hypothetical protein
MPGRGLKGGCVRVCWCVLDPGRSCRGDVFRLMGIRCFVGEVVRAGGRQLGDLLYRVDTLLDVVICAVRCGGIAGGACSPGRSACQCFAFLVLLGWRWVVSMR